MNLRTIKGGLALSACILTMAAFAAPAAADPFSQALVASANPLAHGIGNTCDIGSTFFDCQQSKATGPNTPTVTQSYSQSVPGNFSTNIYAQANLATATLKVKAAASTSTGAAPYVQSNATFSDGFKTTSNATNSPFVWGNNTATFDLHLGAANTLNSSGNTNAAGFVLLAINTYGSTNADSSWLGTSATITYFLYTFGHDTSIGYGYEDPVTHDITRTDLTTTQFYSSVPTDITATFAPGGDFDWVMLFGISGQPFDMVSSFNYDFSHTLTLNYIGPDGTSFTSDSGIFGTQKEAAVPEPLTLSLFGAGFAGMAALRRRKAKSA
jgi:hypothetical protein